MSRLPLPDLLVLLAYLIGIVVLGSCFVRRSGTTEQFMAGGRSLSGWAVGLSMFGSYISSISFLANPGASFKGNWNPFVFSLATPIAAFIAVKWFVPLYRRGVTYVNGTPQANGTAQLYIIGLQCASVGRPRNDQQSVVDPENLESTQNCRHPGIHAGPRSTPEHR